MRATWAAAVAAVLVTTGLAGCGESEGSGAADPTDPPSASSSATTSPTDETSPPEDLPSDKGRCPYLDAEQVTATLGAPTKETAATVNACFFDPESGEGPSVLLSRVDVQIDPAEYAHQSRALCKGDVTTVDAGDVAFACVMGLGPQGQLYVGPVLVNVAVNDASDEATGIAMAAALLPEVTIPPTGG